jgi:gentisate 1,2-dioxygenase
VWLDVLDLPLVHYLETSYHVNGGRQTVKPEHGESAYARGGLLPSPAFQRSGKTYPMLRYPWTDARAALASLATDRPDLEAVQLTYSNPETGAHCENILGFYALMLRPGQRLNLPARSPATVLHQIEGKTQVQVDAQVFALAEADTCCVPGYTSIALRNLSADQPAFLFMADEAPLHQKLGVYELR